MKAFTQIQQVLSAFAALTPHKDIAFFPPTSQGAFLVLLHKHFSEPGPHSGEESSPLFPQEGAPPLFLMAVQGVSTNDDGGPAGCYLQSAKGGNGVTVCNLLLYPCKLTSASLIILLKSRILIVLPAEIQFWL